MAEQSRKSQAERAAESKNKTKKKSSNKAKSTQKQVRTTPAEKHTDIPVRLITSIVFLALFVLLLIIAFIPEGVFVDLLNSLICGLIGKTAFTVPF